ncbi:hypothetical protein DL96DRAFT_122989 [Flagelloscypha sp. PMI_526]|nr:hypothetical protein DL96DRAFT_122989 [Flagelloscypha sp. PMI_526]
MALPLDLVPIICSFCDKPSLATICLTNRDFCSEARIALYCCTSFSSLVAAEHFLRCADRHLSLVKHLDVYTPSIFPAEMNAWTPLLSAVRDRAQLISLKISSNPVGSRAVPDFQSLIYDLLSLPSLEYAAVTTILVPVANALRCRALKELDIVGDWVSPEDPLIQEGEILLECEKPRLYTLCHNWHRVSLPLLRSLFNLSGLTRLAMNQKEPDYIGPMIQLVEATCSTLQELALWMIGPVDREAVTQLRGDIDESAAACEVLVSIFSPTSPQLRELRLYFHSCGPFSMLSMESESFLHFDLRISVIRMFFRDASVVEPERKCSGEKAEELLRERLGPARDFRVEWKKSWVDLTQFCELRSGKNDEILGK